MASSTTHQAFPSRPYTSGLGRNSSQTPYSTQTPYGAPNPQANPLLNYGSAAQNLALQQAQSSQQQQQQQPQSQQHPQQQSQQRERDRLERERREAEDRDALDQLSEEQREEVNEAFILFDLDKDQHIDYHEVKVAFKALGFELSKSELLGILQTHGVPASQLAGGAGVGAKPDLHQQGAVTFTGPNRLLLSHQAFLQLAAQKIAARDPREEILRAFELFDTNNTGLITLEDLRRVARELGEGLQEEELAAMIDEFDVRGEGGISREEFVGICLG